jgi:hypothetical protein
VTDDEPINVRVTETQQEDAPPPDPDGFDFDTFEASIVDISEHHDPYYVVKDPAGVKHEVRYKPAIRAPESVTGMCLHHTACVMGENPLRYKRLSIHGAITLEGVPIKICKDFLELLYGGDGWNNGTIQFEVDGAYAGLEDDPTTLNRREDTETFWAKGPVKSPMKVTPAAMRTLRNYQRYIIELGRRRGFTIKVIVAHRQSSADRPADPGQAIWQQGAVPILEEYGLHDGGPGFKIGSGRPLPDAWTGKANGIGY